MNKTFVFGLVFILLISGVSAVCYNVTDHLAFGAGSYDLCSGTFYAPDAADNGTIYVYASNVKITCNNTIIVGNNRSASKGFQLGGGAYRSNISVIDCVVKDFGENYFIQRVNQLNLTNDVSIHSTYLAGFYIGAVSNAILHNLSAYDNVNSSNHGLYLTRHSTASTVREENITISNSRFYNNSGNGIAINALTPSITRVRNVTIKDSYFEGNVRGLNFLSGQEFNVYNNTLKDNQEQMQFSCDGSDGNITSGAYNNSIHDNNFYDATNGQLLFTWCSQLNRVYNNTYHSSQRIDITPNSTKGADFKMSFSLIENLNHGYIFSKGSTNILNANVTFNYSGIVDFNMTDEGITINNMISPNNDVKNKTGHIVAQDVTTYSKTLIAADAFSVGDYYTAVNVCTPPNATTITPLEDISISQNNIINSGSTYISSGFYSLNGINNYLSIPYISSFNVSGLTSSTMCGRFNFTGTTSMSLIAWYYDWNGGSPNSWQMFYDATTTSILCERSTPSGPYWSISNNYTPYFNKETLVCCSFDGTNVYNYINGSTDVASTWIAYSAVYSSNSPVTIGTNGGSPYNGTVDDAMLFNTSLSAVQIDTIANHSAITTGLIGSYPFTNQTGTSNWSIPMSDNCTINQDFNGSIYLNGTGKVYLNSTLNTSNVWLPQANQIRYFLNNARLY